LTLFIVFLDIYYFFMSTNINSSSESDGNNGYDINQESKKKKLTNKYYRI